jgi:hypothetical protein
MDADTISPYIPFFNRICIRRENGEFAAKYVRAANSGAKHAKRLVRSLKGIFRWSFLAMGESSNGEKY